MSKSERVEASPDGPAHSQVKEQLLRRIVQRDWLPGQIVPSEIELAREFGVGQDEIREAIGALMSENLLVGDEGRGVVVVRLDENRSLSHFFRLVAHDGEPGHCESTILARAGGEASREEAALLDLARGAPVWRVERVCTLDGRTLLVETIVLPALRFPGFEDMKPVPGDLYAFYSANWSIGIDRVSERLRAISASRTDAAALGCVAMSPLLEISRVAFDPAGNPVELRISRCRTDRAHYASELR